MKEQIGFYRTSKDHELNVHVSAVSTDGAFIPLLAASSPDASCVGKANQQPNLGAGCRKTATTQRWDTHIHPCASIACVSVVLLFVCLDACSYIYDKTCDSAVPQERSEVYMSTRRNGGYVPVCSGAVTSREVD